MMGSSTYSAVVGKVLRHGPLAKQVEGQLMRLPKVIRL